MHHFYDFNKFLLCKLLLVYFASWLIWKNLLYMEILWKSTWLYISDIDLGKLLLINNGNVNVIVIVIVDVNVKVLNNIIY